MAQPDRYPKGELKEWLDFSWPLCNGSPVYPGDPQVLINRDASHLEDGCHVMRIELGSHAGTHMDAPYHIFHDGKTLDQYPVGYFCGPGRLIDLCAPEKPKPGTEAAEPKKETGETTEKDESAAFERLLSKGSGERPAGSRNVKHRGLVPGSPIFPEDLGDLSGMKRTPIVLIRTGWDAYWGKRQYLRHPYLTEEAAKALVDSGARIVGLDTFGPDVAGSTHFEAHKTLLARDVLILENLRGLERLAGRRFRFYALPICIEKGDGAPIRAVAGPLR